MGDEYGVSKEWRFNLLRTVDRCDFFFNCLISAKCYLLKEIRPAAVITVSNDGRDADAARALGKQSSARSPRRRCARGLAIAGSACVAVCVTGAAAQPPLAVQQPEQQQQQQQRQQRHGPNTRRPAPPRGSAPLRRRRRAFRQHADEGAAARALHAEPAALPGVPVQAAAAALRHGGGPAAEQGPAGAQPGDRAARHRAAPLRAHHRLLLQLRPGVCAAGNTDGVATVPSAGRAEGLRVQRHDHQLRQPHTLRLCLQHRGQRHGDRRLGDQQRLLNTSNGQAVNTSC